MQPLGVVAGGDQQRSSDLGPDPVQLAQPRRRVGGEAIQLGVHRRQLGLQGLVALAQQAQGQLGRRFSGQDRPWP